VVVRAALAISLLVAAATAGAARADDMRDGPAMREKSGASMMGLDLEYGWIHVHDTKRFVFSDGLSAGVSLPWRLHVSGELAVEYLFPLDGSKDNRDSSSGWGLRGGVGVRRTLGTAMVFYADAEAGAGVTGAIDPQLGDVVVPDVYAGLRVGYDMGTRDPGARAFEAGFDARVVATPDGTSLMFGVGLGWGGGVSKRRRHSWECGSSE
jgi:hypothetical protein